jgi:hypothetical protein
MLLIKVKTPRTHTLIFFLFCVFPTFALFHWRTIAVAHTHKFTQANQQLKHERTATPTTTNLGMKVAQLRKLSPTDPTIDIRATPSTAVLPATTETTLLDVSLPVLVDPVDAVTSDDKYFVPERYYIFPGIQWFLLNHSILIVIWVFWLLEKR